MLAKRTKNISPFIVMEILERAQKLEGMGKNVIHLEIGEPDFATPKCVIEANNLALKSGHTHYTHSLGDLELRQALSDFYNWRYNVSIDPDRFLITSGTSPGMLLLFGAILDPFDEVILSNPHYACYPNFVEFCGAKAQYVKVKEEEGFLYQPEAIKEKLNSKVKAILINSPSNPTGTVLGVEKLKAIAGLGFVVSDEIYHGLSYGPEPEHTILEFTNNAVVVGGFSKTFAMTGWRIGYLILPEILVRTFQKLAQNFFISANAAAQKASIVALKEAWPEVLEKKEIYNERRKVLLKGLNDLGLTVKVEPTGAFYALANARHLNPNSYELAFDILEKALVGVTPGIDFGSEAEGFLRFSYANSVENIKEALKRLEIYIAKNY